MRMFGWFFDIEIVSFFITSLVLTQETMVFMGHLCVFLCGAGNSFTNYNFPTLRGVDGGVDPTRITSDRVWVL